MAQVKPVNKKKMSGPSLAALIVTIAILLGLVVSLLAGSGLFVRLKKGASSENFEINGSMMSYYTNSYYQSWYSQNYYYILLGYVKFDPNTPLSEQYTDNTKTKTYYDFFVEGATSNITKILKYCEAAKADSEFDFAAIEEEAKTYAKDTIKSLKDTARKNGYDFTTFVRQNFGQYVNESDLKNSIVLEYIASEYSEVMYDRIFDGMTDDRKTEYFENNLSSFIKAEYLTFSLSQTVSPETVDEKKYPLGKEDPDYLAAVEAAKEAAKRQNEMNKIAHKEFIDKLAKATSAEEFKRYLIEYKYDEQFTAAYDAAVNSFVAADKPSSEEVEAFKAEIKQAVIDAVMAGKNDITSDDEVEEAAETEESATETKWEKAKKSLPASVITKLKSVITTATKSVAYSLDNNVSKFLFAGVKAQYGIDYAEGEEQGENAEVGDYYIDEKTFSDTEKEEAEKIGKYTYTVYFVTKTAYRDETMLRNVGHILFQVDETGKTEGAFKTWDEAKAKAEEVLAQIQATAKDGVVEKDVFETFGKEHTSDSNVFYEDVNKGDMVEEFEEWLFAATKVGEVGLVKTADYGYHIMFYNGESDLAWKVSAHEAATNEDLNTWYEELKYEVSVNAGIFKTILGE